MLIQLQRHTSASADVAIGTAGQLDFLRRSNVTLHKVVKLVRTSIYACIARTGARYGTVSGGWTWKHANKETYNNILLANFITSAKVEDAFPNSILKRHWIIFNSVFGTQILLFC